MVLTSIVVPSGGVLSVCIFLNFSFIVPVAHSERDGLVESKKNPNAMCDTMNMDLLLSEKKEESVHVAPDVSFGSPSYYVSNLSCTEEVVSSSQSLQLSIPSVSENVSGSPVIPSSDSDVDSTTGIVHTFIPLSLHDILYGSSCEEPHSDNSIAGSDVPQSTDSIFSAPKLQNEQYMRNDYLFHEDGYTTFCDKQPVTYSETSICEDSICISIPSQAPDYYNRAGARRLSAAAKKLKKSTSRLFEPHVRRILENWMTSHKHDPYCSKREKLVLSSETGLSVDQITMWFCNYRRRVLNKHH